MDVSLVAVTEADKPVLANLLQLYRYDFSEIRGYELTPHGTFVYRFLDHYFTDAGREAHFITVDGQLAGFALARSDVHEDGSWNVGEFFVVRRHRGKGVARAAAVQLWSRHPGVWTLAYDHANQSAAAFWNTVVDSVADGPVTRADRYPPDVSFPGTWLRFQAPAPAASPSAHSVAC